MYDQANNHISIKIKIKIKKNNNNSNNKTNKKTNKQTEKMNRPRCCTLLKTRFSVYIIALNVAT